MVEESLEGEGGVGAWSLVSRVAGAALGLPVVAGFVLLGAAVVAGRELRNLLRGRAGHPSVESGEPVEAAAERPRSSAAA